MSSALSVQMEVSLVGWWEIGGLLVGDWWEIGGGGVVSGRLGDCWWEIGSILELFGKGVLI